jgi:methyl-accepting chemotaxis protein
MNARVEEMAAKAQELAALAAALHDLVGAFTLEAARQTPRVLRIA